MAQNGLRVVARLRGLLLFCRGNRENGSKLIEEGHLGVLKRRCPGVSGKGVREGGPGGVRRVLDLAFHGPPSMKMGPCGTLHYNNYRGPDGRMDGPMAPARDGRSDGAMAGPMDGFRLQMAGYGQYWALGTPILVPWEHARLAAA